MNHDVSHCADYKPDECPVTCYRAQLTEDLLKRPDLMDIPITWTHLYGTPCCSLKT